MKLQYILLLMFLALPCVFISCSSPMYSVDESYAPQADYADYGGKDIRGRFESEFDTSLGETFDKGYELKKEAYDEEGTISNNATTPKESGVVENASQKIIYTAYLNIGVYDPELIKKKIIEALRSLGGFVQEETNMNLVLRIPVAAFNQMVEEIIKYGRVISKNISAFDVTEEFYDLVARLKVKKEALGVLQELLKTTESKQLQLEILREIRILQEEIERAEARLKYLRDKVSLSTITVQLTLEQQIRKAPSHIKIPVNWLNWHSLEDLIE